MGAERLRQLAEFRRVQPDRERPARDERGAARPGAQRLHERALGLVHMRFFDQGEAWRRAFGGHNIVLAVVARAQGIETGRADRSIGNRGAGA